MSSAQRRAARVRVPILCLRLLHYFAFADFRLRISPWLGMRAQFADNLGGDMQTLALRLLKGKRDTDEAVDESLARKHAHQLKVCPY